MKMTFKKMPLKVTSTRETLLAFSAEFLEAQDLQGQGLVDLTLEDKLGVKQPAALEQALRALKEVFN